MTITNCKALFACHSVAVTNGISVITAYGIACAECTGVGFFTAGNRIVGTYRITGNRIFLFCRQQTCFLINGYSANLISCAYTQRTYTGYLVFFTKCVALFADSFVAITGCCAVISARLVGADGFIGTFSFCVDAITSRIVFCII